MNHDSETSDRGPLAKPRCGLDFPPPPDCYGDYDENGVDVSLIQYMLRRTPLERLVLMEQHARDTQVLFEYGRRHRETKAAEGR